MTNDFPATAQTPGQEESRTAYQAFLADGESAYAWWSDYVEIRARFPHFSNWRIWGYVAWAGSPLSSRQPPTEAALADEVLGCTTRAIRNWKSRDWVDEEGQLLPGIDEAVAWVQASPLLAHRRDIYEALIESARLIGRDGHGDRKVALQMMGDYDPSQRQVSGQIDVALPPIQYIEPVEPEGDHDNRDS